MIYRKSDIAQAKISLPQDQKQRKSPSAEPQKKLQRINSPETLEEIDSDEELRRPVELADFVNPIDRFQQSQTVKTSKDIESGWGLNLANKRAKPATGGSSSIAGPKTQEEVALKKTEKKSRNKNQVDQPETSTKQTASAISTPDKDV